MTVISDGGLLVYCFVYTSSSVYIVLSSEYNIQWLVGWLILFMLIAGFSSIFSVNGIQFVFFRYWCVLLLIWRNDMTITYEGILLGVQNGVYTYCSHAYRFRVLEGVVFITVFSHSVIQPLLIICFRFHLNLNHETNVMQDWTH